MGVRGLLAVWAAKATTSMSRAFGKGGSTLPGRVARRIDPLILRKMACQLRMGSILVTGTNGKTTTSRMISSIARTAGLRVTSNRSGANLIHGVVASYVQSCDLLGRLNADVGVVEVDEATMPAAAVELEASGAVVTNFFRDQLDRFGEIATTVLLVKKGLDNLPRDAFVCLNADDPMVSSLGREAASRTTFYGLEDRGLFAPGREQAADVRNCLNCGAPLEYEGVYYSHLGVYRCPSCGAARPEPAISLVSHAAQARGSLLVLNTPAGRMHINLPVPGVYNAYNALAAVACCLAIGIAPEHIKAGLESYGGSFGRMESIVIGGRTVLMALVKNPAGFNEVIRTVVESPEEKHLVICINDNYADGTDVSWLWDVDFERLAGLCGTESVIASGIRADDMAVRLKYAGLDPARLTVEGDLKAALEKGLSRVPEGGTLYVLPTYTAMLELRRVIHSMGYARMFWED